MNETGCQLMTRIDYVKNEMKVFFYSVSKGRMELVVMDDDYRIILNIFSMFQDVLR